MVEWVIAVGIWGIVFCLAACCEALDKIRQSIDKLTSVVFR